ncbi:T9SS type A sorting domain-containing protein, partial [candidate division KSB1 bacterium]|nr:T9SS type A sorting domain-containing protein [candidate division KSB1 bacterium]
ALFSLAPGAEIRIEILESEFEELPDIAVAPAPDTEIQWTTEEVFQRYTRDPLIYAQNSFWPGEVVSFVETGVLRGEKIARVRVAPVQYNPVTKVVRVYRKLRFRVTFSAAGTGKRAPGESEPFRKLKRGILLNDTGGRFAEPGSGPSAESGWYNPQFEYHKLFVEEDGIYSLTYDDLVSAGVPASQLNLSTLKLINKGQEIPVAIEGPESGVFSPGNRLTFYGTRHRGDSTYFDYYTDANVYWLTDDGEAGLRYQLQPNVEPAGNAAAFYTETLRLEEEHIFHRSNGSSAIEADEGWIWRYLFENQIERIPFQITGLYRAANVCSLRARLHGTTLDPASPDHHVQISINGQNVVDVFFDDREELVLSVPFQTGLLRNGENTLEVTLLSDTGAQVNQIYLDWIEISYPRPHAAAQNTVRFAAPISAGQPVKYELLNFQDEQVRVFAPDLSTAWQPQVQRRSHYRVESAGFDDGKFALFEIDFGAYRTSARGHNLAVITGDGQPLLRHFDTFDAPEEADAMAAFVDSLAPGIVVLAAIVDEGSASMTENAYLALESLGSLMTRQVGARDSWALIGVKGAAVGSVAERLSRRFSGSAVIVDTLEGSQAQRFSATFVATLASTTTFVASDSAGVRQVVNIQKDELSDLRNTAEGADYLVISHRDFLEAARRLAQYRQEHNGYRTTVIDVQDIYDEFNYGIISPHAIKSFLQYAQSNWQPPAPSFLVLFGDASWDPKKYGDGAEKRNFVTSYGSLVADNWFVSLDGDADILPDMFVGRIPVETAEQAAMVVDKIIRYEASPFDAWSKRFIFLNGGISSVEQSIFLSQATTLIDRHLDPAPLGGDIISFNKTESVSISRQFKRLVADEIDSGALWVNFLGHAGSSIWDIDIGLPEDWRNRDVFPFMTGMSCHSARFANPAVNSLSELYFVNEIGAAAYWGSSGFGYITQDFFLLDGLFKAIAKDTVRSVGEATLRAKLHLWQQLGGQPRSRFVIEQYTLVGDPAMALRIPEQPELAVRSEDITFESEFLLATDAATTVSAKVRNYGLVPEDSVQVAFTALAPGGSAAIIAAVNVVPIRVIDSVAVSWNIPDQVGNYRIRVHADPANRISEADEFNNAGENAIVVFASDLTPIRPLNFAVLNSSMPHLVTGNSIVQKEELAYFFELDTTLTFNSGLLRQSGPLAEGKLVTSWRPELPVPATYFWQVRTFDGASYGAWARLSFTFQPDDRVKWLQSDSAHFATNRIYDNIGFSPGDFVLLGEKVITYRAESGGFLDGNYDILERNREILRIEQRGHNVAAFSPVDGRLLAAHSYDTYKSTDNADSLADFIGSFAEGSIVLVAIKDDGFISMTERAYQALESIGSQFTRQVAFRDSWAIIGRKGAPIGSVVEGWKRSGEGPVVIADTLTRFSTLGRMMSVDIGPALQWKSVRFDAVSSYQKERIRFNVLGRNRNTGEVDTLLASLTQVESVDISGIDAGVYRTINLQAVLESDDGLQTPRLNAWAVDFEPPSDLVVSRTSLTAENDTLDFGKEVNLTLEAGNFGLSASDSFTVRIVASQSGESSQVVSEFTVAGLEVDQTAAYSAAIAPGDLLGRVTLTATIDAGDVIPEINESNNTVSTEVWVERDTLSPAIRVTFDGRQVAEDDFVSARPNVVVEIRDRAGTVFQDTSQVTIFLDQEKIGYGSGQAELIPQQDPEDANLRALVVFSPELAQGEHEIEVIARDASNNLQYFRAQFFVSDQFVLGNVMNFPNPFSNSTDFTYTLTQAADHVWLKLYTVSGRLILQLDPLPGAAGFNSIHWDGLDQQGDRLANGVYLYKLIATRNDQQAEVVEKLAVVR